MEYRDSSVDSILDPDEMGEGIFTLIDVADDGFTDPDEWSRANEMWAIE